MAKLKINDDLNVEPPNMRIGKIASSAEYRMDKQSQNFLIFDAKFWFSELKNSRNLFGKF